MQGSVIESVTGASFQGPQVQALPYAAMQQPHRLKSVSLCAQLTKRVQQLEKGERVVELLLLLVFRPCGKGTVQKPSPSSGFPRHLLGTLCTRAPGPDNKYSSTSLWYLHLSSALEGAADHSETVVEALLRSWQAVLFSEAMAYCKW